VSIGDYDLIQGAIVSLASLLFGMILFGTLQAWRQRFAPAKRAPFWATSMFSAGYLLLLAHLIAERWVAFGSPHDLMAYLSLTALVINTLAVGAMVHFARPPKLTTWDVRRVLRRLKWWNIAHWRKTHDGTEPPHMTRMQDKLADMPEAELSRELDVASAELYPKVDDE
jgi:hypothetical protein